MSVEEEGFSPRHPTLDPSFCFGIFAANDLNEHIRRR
jgi:hypothetical protein